MIARLIKIYTPFICALSAIIHGVLYFIKYRGIMYSILNEFTGHSFLLIIYIICSSKKMCIWYKITNYLLLSIHIFNICCTLGYIEKKMLFNTILVINILALISFLIYRVTKGITKILC